MSPSNHTRRVIVNADDFGLNAETNRAIIDAFSRNAISSATIMTNMPGFEEACELAHSHHLEGKIGLHLNLTCGYPLSRPIRRCTRFCDANGAFRKRRNRLWLTSAERLAVETEVAAQIRACLDRGVVPTHLDSHHHVHTVWGIGAAAIAVSRRYGVNAVRLMRNCGSGRGTLHKLYNLAFNGRLRVYGLAKTRYFGSPADIQHLPSRTNGVVEVMVHLQSTTPTGADEADRFHSDMRASSMRQQLIDFSSPLLREAHGPL